MTDGPQVCFALYRAHQGKEPELRKLLAEHIPTLRRRGLITDRPVVLVRAKNGTYVEIFEWRNAGASDRAHEDPEVGKIWGAMSEIADLPALDSLEEAKGRFPHFEPVTL